MSHDRNTSQSSWITSRKNTSALNNKALSPIFATLIILAVVTVLFIPVFIWATGTASQTEDSWQQSGLIATERIVIEEVNLKNSPASCTVYVRNIGKTAVSVENVFIYLSDSTGTTYVYSKSASSLGFTASPANPVTQGELITITFPDLGFTPTTNKAYTVKVFTTLGKGDEYQVVVS